MNTKPQPRKQIAARVTLDTDRILRLRAAERGVTKSQLLAELIEQHYPAEPNPAEQTCHVS